MKTLLTILAAALLSACGYGWKEEPAAYPPSSKAPASTVVGRAASPGEYQVQPGDTLYAIGFRNQIDYHDLAAWNGIGGDYVIRPGQILRLTPPAGTDAVIARPLPTPAPATSAPVPIAPPQPIPSSIPGPGSGPGPITQPPVVPPPAVPVLSVPPVPKPMPRGNSALRWQWPTSGEMIRGYNMTIGSKGIDLGGELGQPVHAAAGGKVVYSGSALKGYGELIIVKHDDTYLSAYGHNRRRLVKEGDEVRAGQTIAELGGGPEQKPILHFEVRENGKPVDPLLFLPSR